MDTIRILALSGSLRHKSYNTALITAVAELAPKEINVVIFNALGDLPLFNPDRENETIDVVQKLQHEIKISNGLIISSPEYAHGISGVLKNALDWLVSGDGFPYLPVALFNTAPRASHAQATLKDVITTMSGSIIESASLSLPLLGSNLDTTGIINNDSMSKNIMTQIKHFRDEIITLQNQRITITKNTL